MVSRIVKDGGSGEKVEREEALAPQSDPPGADRRRRLRPLLAALLGLSSTVFLFFLQNE